MATSKRRITVVKWLASIFENPDPQPEPEVVTFVRNLCERESPFCNTDEDAWGYRATIVGNWIVMELYWRKRFKRWEFQAYHHFTRQRYYWFEDTPRQLADFLLARYPIQESIAHFKDEEAKRMAKQAAEVDKVRKCYLEKGGS